MPEPCSVYIFPWLAQPFHFKMFPYYNILEVAENKVKGKRSGCKHIWSLSNHSASLRLFYFPHCRPFDSDLSPQSYTSHRWRNNSKYWPSLGFLLALPVSPLGQAVKAVKLLGMAVLAEQAQVAWSWEFFRYYSWIHKITYWTWLCSVQVHLKQRILPAPLQASHELWCYELKWCCTWQVEHAMWGWALSLWEQLLDLHRNGE